MLNKKTFGAFAALVVLLQIAVLGGGFYLAYLLIMALSKYLNG